MRKRKIQLYKTTCRRCGKEIYTATHSLYGLNELKAKYDRIYKDCITEPEKQEAIDGIAQGILRSYK